MITKTSMIVDFLMSRIDGPGGGTGTRLPSQQQLMKLFNCSRVTVLRALDVLKRDGIISGNQGRGTFVCGSEKKRNIEELIDIKDKRCSNTEAFDNAVSSLDHPKLPIRWLTAEQAAAGGEKFFHPGNGVIWIWAPLRYLQLMEHLKKRHIPQLLLNRDYNDFDYIATDSKASIREGLTWLLIESGRNIAFVSRKPSVHYPFLAERILCFYECCFETNTLVTPDRVYMSDFFNITEDIKNIGKQLFDRNDPPRGIFVMNREFALLLVLCASQHGLQMGRDYFLLVFDNAPELQTQKGFAEMIQESRSFRDGIADWLNIACDRDHPLFSCMVKTVLRIHN